MIMTPMEIALLVLLSITASLWLAARAAERQERLQHRFTKDALDFENADREGIRAAIEREDATLLPVPTGDDLHVWQLFLPDAERTKPPNSEIVHAIVADLHRQGRTMVTCASVRREARQRGYRGSCAVYTRLLKGLVVRGHLHATHVGRGNGLAAYSMQPLTRDHSRAPS